MVSKPEVAIAILYQDNQFLMQLRDNIPGIFYPGYWAFFGGHLEAGEDPTTAVYREIQEEIGYTAPRLTLFDRMETDQVIRNIFYGPLVVPMEQLVLNEGWDMALWTIPEIHQGRRYSEQAGEERPLSPIHQQILFSFLDGNLLAQEARGLK